MSSSFALLLVAGMAVGENRNESHFENYAKGWRAARQTNRPMLVILNPGDRDGKDPIELGDVEKTAERRKLLEDYVVVVVDTETEYGRAVHEAFRRPPLPRVVVIDKDQQVQLFKTSGPLYGQRWTEILQTYRNGEHFAMRRPAGQPFGNYLPAGYQQPARFQQPYQFQQPSQFQQPYPFQQASQFQFCPT